MQTMTSVQPTEENQPSLRRNSKRRVEFDYLRTFVVVLVVLHHAVLAYSSAAFINPTDPIQTFTPVADSQRWVGFDLLTGFMDVFFMALMFMISGLFVWKSLQHKGAAGYMKDRFIRLGIPFLIAVPFLIPLAYYPAQLTVNSVYGGETTYLQFWWEMVRNGFQTAGPLWFLWLLLVFDALVTIFYRLWSTRSGASSQANQEQSSGLLKRLFNRPLPLLLVLFVLSAAAYLLMASFIPPYEWVGIGPFVAQGSRLLFYLVYFSLGVLLGAYGLERGMLSERGSLSRRWWLFLPLGIVAWGALVVIVISPQPNAIVSGILFALTCASLVFGFIAIFLRFVTRRVGILDSLTASAYGIYIVHYLYNNWLQYSLLGVELSAIVKATIVFVATLLLSWGTVALLRRSPAVARVLG